jgi:hypothetical protein
LDEANAIVVTPTQDLEIGPAECIDGITVSPVIGDVRAVHWACDNSHQTPHVPLASIFRSDQRSLRDSFFEEVKWFA